MPKQNHDPRYWRASTIDHPDRWRIALSESSLSALDRFDHALPNDSPITSLKAPPWLRAAAGDDVRCILESLESGRGFSIVTAGDPGRFSPTSLTRFYWLLGDLLGRPIEQNVQGTLLYDVRDTGQDVQYGARFSVTNSESSFHTDNSFGDNVLDYVGLLCLNAARSGGESQIVSGYTVADELRSNHPKDWEVLRGDFHFDRRGGLRPGDEPTVRYPILAESDIGLVIRYLRYWIEVGHEKAGVPLSSQQIEAMNTLDQVAGQPGLRVAFTMKPGEMLIINNRWLLHNRTAFEDHQELDRRRHFVRLWVVRS